MAVKGTLATFNIATLKDTTVDERRAVRNFLKEKAPDTSGPSLEVLQKIFSDCMMADEEIREAERGLEVLPAVMGAISWFAADVARDEKNYEAINLHRLKSTVESLPKPLERNVQDIKRLADFQHAVPVAVKDILDAARSATPEMLREISSRSFELMCAIADDEKGMLYPDRRINESHQSHMKDMNERFKTGYIYHWSVEDELQKVPFDEIFSRLEEGQKSKFNDLSLKLEELNDSVEATYRLNWRQIMLIRRVYSVLHECLKKYFEEF